MDTEKWWIVGFVVVSIILGISAMIYNDSKNNHIEKALVSGQDTIAVQCAFGEGTDNICIRYQIQKEMKNRGE